MYLCKGLFSDSAAKKGDEPTVARNGRPNAYWSAKVIIAATISNFEVPISLVAGLESISIVIAIMAALVGTVLALGRFSLRIMTLVGVLFVPAIFFYSLILSRAGAPNSILLLALFLYFYMFFAFAYVLSHLEWTVVSLRDKSRGIPPPEPETTNDPVRTEHSNNHQDPQQ